MKKRMNKIVSLSLALSTAFSLFAPVVHAETNEQLINWSALVGDKGAKKTVLFDTVNDALSSDGEVITAGVIDGNEAVLPNGKGDHDALITARDRDGKEKWRTYTGGSKQDYYNALTEDREGKYVAVGASKSGDGDFQIKNTTNYDAVIAKYDRDGTLLKTASFGGSEKEEFNDVTYTFDGGYMAVGYTHSTDGNLDGIVGADHKREAIAVKFNKELEVQWVATSGEATESAAKVHHQFEAVELDDEGNIIVAGTSNVATGEMQGLNQGKKDGFVVKYTSDGKKVWVKAFGGSEDDSIDSFARIPSNDDLEEPGGFIITGTTKSNDGLFDGTNSAARESGYILRLDAEGNKQWVNTLECSGKVSAKSVLNIFDGYLVTGTFDKNDQDFTGLTIYGKEDMYIAHYSKDGYLRKIHSIGGSDKDSVEGISRGFGNSYILYGSSRSKDNMFEQTQGPVDGFVMNLNGTTVEQYAAEKYLVPIKAWKLDEDVTSMMAPLLYKDAYVEKTGELYTITAYFVNANIMGTQVNSSSLGAVSYDFGGTMKPALEDVYNSTTQVKTVKITSTDLTKPIKIHIEDAMGDIRFSFTPDNMVETETPPYFPDIEVVQPDFNNELKLNIGGSDVDYANDMVTLDNGNLVVVGQTYSKDGDFNPHLNSYSNAFINIYSEKGELLSTQLLGAEYFTTNVYASSVIKSNDGGYVVGGSYLDLEYMNGPSGDFSEMDTPDSVHGETDSFIAKYDTQNKLVWMKNFSGSHHDQMKYLLEDKDGFLAVIESNSKDGDMSDENHGLFDLAVVKYSYDGEKQWQRVVGGKNIESSRSIGILKNGNYVLAGHTSSGSGDFQDVEYFGDLFDIFVAEINRQGEVVKVKTFGGNKNDYCNKILGTSDGGYLLAGHTNSTTGSFEGVGSSYDNAFVMKVDAEGNREWCDILKSSDKSEVVDLQERQNCYVAFGDSRGNDFDFKGMNKGSRDSFLARYNKGGVREYLETIGGTGADYAAGMTACNSYQNVLLFYGPSNDGDVKGLNRGDYDGTLVVYNEDEMPVNPSIPEKDPVKPEGGQVKPEVKPSVNSENTSDRTKGKASKTGDSNDVVLYGLIFLLATGTLMIGIRYRRGKKVQ